MDFRRRRQQRHQRWHRRLAVFAGVVVLIVVAQLLYPTTRLLPLQFVDGVSVGGATKTDVAATINADYAKRTLPLYVSDAQQAIATPTFSQLGITANADQQVSAITYPWYWRLVPTSIGWYQFIARGGTPSLSLNTQTAQTELQNVVAAKVARAAGTTTIHTVNFAKKSQDTGVAGRTLDVMGSLSQLQKYVDGDTSTLTLAVTRTPAAVVYDNTYGSEDTALQQVMQAYANSHAGSYAVAMVEIGGKGRYATYNGSEIFTTASTYKLFVAYSTLKRIEDGTWHWSDITSTGYDRRTCFDRMIELSDNNCAESLLFSIGDATVTAEAHAIGATHTTFKNGNITSNADDELLIVGRLASGEILNSQADRDIWISAMKQNVYRDGIPAGIPGSVVADKVGFLNALLHDAAIVYSPKGTYVLIIMTNNATWGDIANLAGDIEAAR